jgi:hypothetical protein
VWSPQPAQIVLFDHHVRRPRRNRPPHRNFACGNHRNSSKAVTRRLLNEMFQRRSIVVCSRVGTPSSRGWRTAWRRRATVVTLIDARQDPQFAAIYGRIDVLLDAIPNSSAHLLLPEASCLHYLKTIRFRWTQPRAQYVLATYSSTTSQTVKRGCIECWRTWKDRTGFNRLRNRWNTLNSEEQRSLWLAAPDFYSEGDNFRAQVKHSIPETCRLGIERQNRPTFASIYIDWSTNGDQ